MIWIKRYYLVVALVLSLLGLSLQYYAGDLGLHYKQVQIIESGKIKSVDVLSPNALTPLANLASSFLITLAISLFISVFIIKKLEVMESESRDKQLLEINKSINENVFDSLFKTLVPEEIYSVIKERIIKSHLVRKNSVWLYDFTLTDDGGIELKQTLKSELHNISNSNYKDDYGVSFKTNSDISRTCVNRFICEFNGKLVADFKREELDFNDGGTKKIPLDIPPGEYADITLVLLTQYAGDKVLDSYYTFHPLIDATLIANYPKGYKFSIFSSFSSPIRETSSDETSSVNELRGGVLPGQGISFVLSKIKEGKKVPE